MAKSLQEFPVDNAAEGPSPSYGRIAVLFTILGALLYAPALLAYFSSDDFLHLGRVIEGKLPFVPDGRTGGFLRPMIGASFWLEYHLWGLRPMAFHLTNFLVHVGNSLMVVALATELRPRNSSGNFFAIASGAIFLVLACHAEPVTWISGRTDVFSTFFLLIGLCGAVRGLRYWNWAPWCASLAGFTLALFSKESALAFPFILGVLVLYAYWNRPLAGKGLPLRWLGALGAIFVLYFACRWVIIGEFIGGYGAHGHLRMNRDIFAQASARFFWRIFFPPVPGGVAEWFARHATILAYLWLAGLLLTFTGLIVIAWKRRTFGPGFLFFLAFWAALIPVINVRIQWIDPEGERFLYLPSIFAALYLGYWLSRLRVVKLRWTALALVLALQGGMLFLANLNWYRAGEIGESIINGLQQAYNDGPLILVNKPDSCAGALIFRTGLEEGLRYFGDAPIPLVVPEVLYAATIFLHDFGFSLSSIEEDGMTKYRIVPTDPTSALAEEDRGDLIETLSTNGQARTFRFRSPMPGAALYYYDAESIKVLTP